MKLLKFFPAGKLQASSKYSARKRIYFFSFPWTPQNRTGFTPVITPIKSFIWGLVQFQLKTRLRLNLPGTELNQFIYSLRGFHLKYSRESPHKMPTARGQEQFLRRLRGTGMPVPYRNKRRMEVECINTTGLTRFLQYGEQTVLGVRCSVLGYLGMGELQN